MAQDDTFLLLSRILTGIEHLPAFLAGEYRERAAAVSGAETIARLVAVVPAQGGTTETVLAAVTADPSLRAAAEQVVMLWYSSATVDASNELIFGTPEQCFAGQLWPVIHAHPPGLSGGYMGHWRYPPE